MDKEKQRIKIAEACGWTFEKKARCNMLSKEPAWHLISPEGKIKCGVEIWHKTHYGPESNYRPFEGELVNYLNISDVPDYLIDLNAMRKAESTMGDPQLWEEYEDNLAKVMNHVGWIWHASASERAEAFLRTLDLWEE